MKKILYMLLIVMTLALIGCSTPEDSEIEPLEKVEKEETQKEDDGYTEVEVADNSEMLENDTEEAALDTVESEDTDLPGIEELVEEDNEDADEAEAVVEEIIANRPSEEFRVLEIEEPEDSTNYTSSLVFIIKEDDLWRVVDRLGKVYRVSSSNESAVSGTVNNGASIEVDEDGKISVSLIRDYTQYDSPLVIETSKEEAGQAFANKLLETQKSLSEGKIDSYSLNSVSQEGLGKGILNVTLNFDVTSSSSVWGSGDDITYNFTIYGYEDTWVLPVKEPLFNQLSLSQNETSTEVVIETSDEALETRDATETAEEVIEEVARENSTETEDNTEVPGYQKVLAIIDGKTLYAEIEKTDEIIGADGSDLTEHKVYLKVQENDEITKIQKGDINGNYEWILNYDSKVLLLNLIEPPAKDSSIAGLSIVDLGDNSYRTLFKGSVAKGGGFDDKYYVFSEDQLLELDLDNNSLRIVTDLEYSLNYTETGIQVLSVDESKMTFTVTISGVGKTYEVILSTGELIPQ